MSSNEERYLQHRINLDAVMNALVDQRRKIVAKAMLSLNDNEMPPRLAAELTEVQNGINAVALAKRQEEMFSVVQELGLPAFAANTNLRRDQKLG